jgi:glucosylceramidase
LIKDDKVVFLVKKIFIASLVFLFIFTSACRAVPDSSTTAPAASSPASSSPADLPAEEAVTVTWTCSAQDAQWQTNESIQLVSGTAADADLGIDTTKLKQEVTGFGGAFNEKGWVALSVLTPDEKDGVIKAMFDPIDGAKFNLGRVPIGASDYAVSRYTLDETDGDYEMNDFSIDRDRENLIPYINAAMVYQPDLQVWGSAWTPPSWMKTNDDFDGGSMKDDPKIYAAYALYLERFVEAYQAEGINLYAVAVQNEPDIERNYPTCLWAPEQIRTFVRDHLGPHFEQNNVNAGIMLGTFDDGVFAKYPKLLTDADVSKYISIVGFQWSGVDAIAQTRGQFPDIQIYQTETKCGNHNWEDGYNPERPPNDWAYGIYTWNLIKEYFDQGVNAYFLWNMVLDEQGKSIDSQHPWPQNAAITVDKTTGKVTYTPMFYAFKHFTYYVETGARYVDLGDAADAIAFLNPDGSLILELQNQSEQPKTLTINVNGSTLNLSLPQMSWNTLVVPGH